MYLITKNTIQFNIIDETTSFTFKYAFNTPIIMDTPILITMDNKIDNATVA